jgi:CheY-like chemotaxis protein
MTDGYKCLIVDDDPMTCQLLKLQLEMEGYSCVTLSDPGQALAVIAAESPALVLADFHLGTQDGLGLLHTIRSYEAYHFLPVVIMSGIDYQKECELAGANGFVLKPFSLQDLLSTIQKVLKG